MESNSPFDRLWRKVMVDEVPERKKAKLSTCFLCGMKPVQDSLPKNITHQEKAALFRDLLLNPTIRKNTSPSSYNQFMSSTESCADCGSLVKKVCALRQEINGLEAEVENRLEESRAKYLNGNCNGFANNNSTGGPSKMHAVGQQNSPTLAGGLSKFPPRCEMELSSEIEDDESMEEEEDENMPSELDDTPTERTMQSKNDNSSTTNTTGKISDWICSHCGKAYSSKSNLYLHGIRRVCKKVRPIPRTKTIKGPFTCSICSKILTSHKLRVAHEMRVCKVVYTQDQVEPLTLRTCPLCDKQFVHLTQYRSHYAAHSKVKKPISSKRGKSIGQVEILGRHHQENRSPQRSVSLVGRKKVSPKEIPLESKMPIYKCSLCTKWFVKEDNLTKHYAENHSKATSRNSTTGDDEVMNIRTQRNATMTETSRNTPQPNKSNGYNANTDFSTASIDLGETLRGKPRLEVNGYCYNFAKFGKNKRIWSCERLRSEKCYARLHTSSQSLSPVEILGDLGTHNHSPVLGENNIGLDDSSVLSGLSPQHEMEMSSDIEDDESMEEEEEEEDMPPEFDDKPNERPVQLKNGHTSTHPTKKHSEVKSSSCDRGKSVGQVEPLRPHQDNGSPQRSVSIVGQDEISPHGKLLGGKMPIYNCSRCPRWFVKEDNLTKHSAKDHGVTKG